MWFCILFNVISDPLKYKKIKHCLSWESLKNLPYVQSTLRMFLKEHDVLLIMMSLDQSANSIRADWNEESKIGITAYCELWILKCGYLWIVIEEPSTMLKLATFCRLFKKVFSEGLFTFWINHWMLPLKRIVFAYQFTHRTVKTRGSAEDLLMLPVKWSFIKRNRTKYLGLSTMD